MMASDRPDTLPPTPVRACVVVANSSKARIFERDDEAGFLREIADLVHPASRQKDAALGRDHPGHVLKGGASTAFAPHTAARERERSRFGSELARLLEEAALAHRMHGLVLMASNPFIGEIKSHLGPAAQRELKAAIALDLTGYRGRELEQRVSRALQDAGAAGAPDGGLSA